jgi:flavin-dependent dehydrogenase
VPHAVVDYAEVLVPGATVHYRGHDLCRVIRRAEFDASLARACSERGVEIRGGDRVVDVRRENGHFRVDTESTSYRADVIVGADGSGSLVRRKLLGAGSSHTGRALMSDVPVAETNWSGRGGARYDFNFLAVADRLRGYSWAFPCVIDGVAHVNVGVYSVSMEGGYLTDLLHREADRLGARLGRIQAFPIHWYEARAPLGRDHALLVGDAAGVDPLMGEGISFCFEYGRMAAAAIEWRGGAARCDASAYERAVRGSWMGKKLRRLRLATRLFYGPAWRLCFGIAAHSRRAQDLGIRWYNGVDGVDRMSLRQGFRLLCSPRGNA